ncbi:MAG: hypothetical protein ACOCXY_03005 [Planctomycetota bacterium]
MGKRYLARDRKYTTFRIFPDEKELLQHLGRGPEDAEDRYEALCELTDMVKTLDLPDIRNRERVPFRVGIPIELDAAIRNKVDQTGQPYIAVLLAAAAEYRRRHPVDGRPQK